MKIFILLNYLKLQNLNIMSFGINRKNIKLRNISFLSPITYTKLNVSNNSESQRITTTVNTTKIFNTQSGNTNKVQINLNKHSKKNSNLYQNYSTNRQFIIHQFINKKNDNNTSYNNNNSLNKSVLNKNNNLKKKNNSSNSTMLSTFANFASNLNKNKNQKINSYYSYIGQNNNNNKNNKTHKRNLTSHIEIRKIKRGSIINNNSSTNINNSSCNNNLIKSSSSNSYFNQSNINCSTEKKKKKSKKKLINEIINFSNDNINLNKNINLSTPLSSVGQRKNINPIYTKVNNSNCNRNNKKINGIKKLIQSNKNEKLQNLKNSSKNTMFKKKIKHSTNSSKNEFDVEHDSNINLKNNNTYDNIKKSINNMNINTPEELHFLYINIIQNGKEMEEKFEITTLNNL